MNILVTGAKGFIGRNLVAALCNIKNGDYNANNPIQNLNVFEYDTETEPSLLDIYCKDADFVFHLAGVNRPLNPKEFVTGNIDFTSVLLNSLKKYDNKCTVMMSSSIQAELGNFYGRSKKVAEELLTAYSEETGARVLIYRLPNAFGKWCRPNYNSVIATFCHNIANELPIQVNDRETRLTLVYIDDIVEEMIGLLNGVPGHKEGEFYRIGVAFSITLGEVVDLLYEFRRSRDDLQVPNMQDPFVKRLYATYTSYLPPKQFSYPLRMHEDARGSFTEILRTPERGQFSVNIIKPRITKGNHWHNTKTEKFLVVSGKGVIRFRKPNETRVYEYQVSGDELEIVDIPAGYTHNIENIGNSNLVTFMWSNECFNAANPDTYHLEV